MKFNKCIVTSGPTREWIDPVRFISNASSGKMGFHIAEEVMKWIPNTIYVHGNVLEKYSNFLGKKIPVESTVDMLNAILSEIERDTILIMAAAPADFKPVEYTNQKIKKIGNIYNLELAENPDILLSVSKYVTEQNLTNVVRVGFAAETENLEENANLKLKRKNIDFIIGNEVGRNLGFGENLTSVKIISKRGIEREVRDQSKENIAISIVKFLKELL